jgi:nodulation protein E
VPGFNPCEHFRGAQLNVLSRFTQFAIVAAREAVCDASIEWSEELREKTATITGTELGGQIAIEAACANMHAGRKVHPLTIVRSQSSAPASAITMEFQLHGPAYSVAGACASASMAIGQAFRMIRAGDAELAIAGGSEAPFAEGHLRAWESLSAMSSDTCRPFSKDRRGMVMGEGGAMLILEPLDRAEARGARIYAEIVGYGSSSDAYHLMRPSGNGAMRAMRAALDDAELPSDEVGYVNAHGTGTVLNDCVEAGAIREVFGQHASRLAVSSTKSMHGHTLGAAGALEAVATVLALHDGVLPPTANFLGPDPECDLDVVPNEPRCASIAAALSNSFGFGGLNAVLAFRKHFDGGKDRAL